jgi:hypothetical protein
LTAGTVAAQSKAGEFKMTWQAELEALIKETKAHVEAMGSTGVQPVAPKKPAVAEPAEAAPAEPPRAQPIERIIRPLVGSEQEEIRQRVASFKTLQARMQREREDYCARTLSNARNATTADQTFPRG